MKKIEERQRERERETLWNIGRREKRDRKDKEKV